MCCFKLITLLNVQQKRKKKRSVGFNRPAELNLPFFYWL